MSEFEGARLFYLSPCNCEVVKELQKISPCGSGPSQSPEKSSDFDKGGRGATRAGNCITASEASSRPIYLIPFALLDMPGVKVDILVRTHTQEWDCQVMCEL